MGCKVERAIIRKLWAENRRLKQRINSAHKEAHLIECQAGSVLSQPNGIPRGQWAYAKGLAMAASRIKSKLK